MEQTKMKIAYVITQRKDRNFWNRVGVAFVNNDGSINVSGSVTYRESRIVSCSSQMNMTAETIVTNAFSQTERAISIRVILLTLQGAWN